MECEVCGHEMERHVWTEECWGRPYRTVEYECVNPNCGEEEDEDED